MNPEQPMLHIICGKIGSGKSTLAAQLAAETRTILITEDAWLNTLYAEELNTMSDYVRCSTRLRGIMGPHISALLKAGLSVVLDYPANTVEQRNWMRSILADADVVHQLHLLDLPDDVCLARLHARNAQGEHPFAVTDAQFHQFTKHFTRPSPGEGFNVVVHTDTDGGTAAG
jgi:predicted kinase